MRNISFLRSFYNTKNLPKNNLPEIVLCGRSNVGKSSFINSFFNRKGIAKISSTPGKTRALNYYLVDEKIYLVDLPGFGYSKVSKSEQLKWQKLIESYFSARKSIKLACHFIDSRHKPTVLDIMLHNYLTELKIPYIIILSKVDKLKQSELAKIKKIVSEIFPEIKIGENLFLYSSVKKTGKKELQKYFNSIL